MNDNIVLILEFSGLKEFSLDVAMGNPYLSQILTFLMPKDLAPDPNMKMLSLFSTDLGRICKD